MFDAGNTSGISLVLDDLDGDPNLDDGGNQNGEIFDGNELLVSFGGDTSNAGLDVNSNDRFTVTGSDGSSFEGTWVAFGDGIPVSSISDILDENGNPLDGSSLTNLIGGGYFAFTQPLVDGGTYTLDASNPLGSISYASLICFARGTMIETFDGECPVEDLKEGDLVLTMDSGYQPISWVGSRKLDRIDLEYNPKLKPIIIHTDALGEGFPKQDLIVSPQHRILVRSSIAERMFKTDEVLIPANKLIAIDGIETQNDCPDGIEYFHILFKDHQIVYSNGAPTESLFTGPEALKSMSPEARKEITLIFPDICVPDTAPAVRYVPEKGKLMKRLAERHHKNNKPLMSRLP